MKTTLFISSVIFLIFAFILDIQWFTDYQTYFYLKLTFVLTSFFFIIIKNSLLHKDFKVDLNDEVIPIYFSFFIIGIVSVFAFFGSVSVEIWINIFFFNVFLSYFCNIISLINIVHVLKKGGIK